MSSNAEAARKRAEAQARKDSRKWVVLPGDPSGGYWYADAIPDNEHGEWSVYNNWYCRCVPCIEANRLKVTKYLEGSSK